MGLKFYSQRAITYSLMIQKKSNEAATKTSEEEGGRF